MNEINENIDKSNLKKEIPNDKLNKFEAELEVFKEKNKELKEKIEKIELNQQRYYSENSIELKKDKDINTKLQNQSPISSPEKKEKDPITGIDNERFNMILEKTKKNIELAMSKN